MAFLEGGCVVVRDERLHVAYEVVA